jgi:hypothetical protein
VNVTQSGNNYGIVNNCSVGRKYFTCKNGNSRAVKKHILHFDCSVIIHFCISENRFHSQVNPFSNGFWFSKKLYHKRAPMSIACANKQVKYLLLQRVFFVRKALKLLTKGFSKSIIRVISNKQRQSALERRGKPYEYESRRSQS